MSRELRIGIFVGAAILILAVFTFIVGDLSVLFKKAGYTVTANFDSAAGLEKKAEVRMSGVKIGFIQDITLSHRKAKIVMAIYPGVEIPKDSKATSSALGILGERFLEIVPGESADNCRQGDELEGLAAVGFDQIGILLQSAGNQIKDAGGAIKEILGPETKANLNQALGNLAALSSDLKDFIGRNQGDIGKTVREAGQSFRNLDAKVEDVAAGLKDTLRVLKDMVAENRETVKLDLEKIKELIDKIEESLKLLNSSLEKINRGEGSVGKAIQNPDLYTKAEDTLDDVRKAVRPLVGLKATAEFRADYYGRSRLVRPAFSLGLWFTPDKFLWAQAVRDPWKDEFVYTLQGGRRFGPLAPRVGLLESEFGVGLDYYALNDRLVLSVEGFDFNRASQPRFRLLSKLFALKNVHVVAGVDDFTLASKREFFLGLGLELR